MSHVLCDRALENLQESRAEYDKEIRLLISGYQPCEVVVLCYCRGEAVAERSSSATKLSTIIIPLETFYVPGQILRGPDGGSTRASWNISQYILSTADSTADSIKRLHATPAIYIVRILNTEAEFAY